MQERDDSGSTTTPPAAAGEGAAPAPEGAAAPEDPVRVLEGENQRLKDQLLRALAENENARRRSQRDREEAVRYAAAAFARDLLNVADNLRRALDAVPAAALESDDSLKTLADGVALTERELLAAFERNGIQRIDPAPGERFDPHLHQAMFEIPNSGQPAGTVVQVMQAGWVMHDRLLRPAMVGIAAGRREDGNGTAAKGNGAES
jgi:molecular chaperone GrpE